MNIVVNGASGAPYSIRNQQFILQRVQTATDCRGIRQWNAAGRKVKKGEKAIYIRVPVGVREDKNGDTHPANYRSARVFDISQTEVNVQQQST